MIFPLATPDERLSVCLRQNASNPNTQTYLTLTMSYSLTVCLERLCVNYI
jgi:hypothetical protein